MADGIDPSMEAMKASAAEAPVDLILAPPDPQQLLPTHHPMLPTRQLGEQPIVTVSP
jgi:hypothetical protein